MPPRQISPKDEQGATESIESIPSASRASKRRAVSSACIPCRKRKSKCDGGVPACSTCTAVYRTECQYDADSDHRRKGALRKDIQSLQTQNNALDIVVNSLRTSPEKDATDLFLSIRAGESLDSLAEGLGSDAGFWSGVSNRTLDPDLIEAPGKASESFTERSPTSEQNQQSWRSRNDSAITYWSDQQSQHRGSEASGSWFRQPQDAEFVDHLLNLYFSWQHPFTSLFPQDLFSQDSERGGTRYCSALSVNAILSHACHFSDRPAARVDPSLPSTAGDHFFEEAKQSAEIVAEPSITTVQASAVMSLRETSHGRDNVGYRYAGRAARMALELGLHSACTGNNAGMRPVDVEARKLTFWGVFNSETICSLSFGRLPQLSRNAADIERPFQTEKTEETIWMPYEDTNSPVSRNAQQPIRAHLFIEHMSRLSESVNDMILTSYSPREKFTPRKLAAAYAEYQAWYNNSPEPFKLQNTSMPQVSILHMYYYMAVLNLFRPFIKLDSQAAGLYPHSICEFCANEISNIINALRGMYGLRRICLASVVTLLSASTVHIMNLPSPHAVVNLTQAFHDLRAMSVNHPSAARCIDTSYRLASKWNVTLPESIATGSILTPTTTTDHTPFTTPPTSSIFTHAMLATEPMNRFQQTPLPMDPPHLGSQAAFQHHYTADLHTHTQHTPFTDPGVHTSQAAMWPGYAVQGVPSVPSSDFHIMEPSNTGHVFGQYHHSR